MAGRSSVIIRKLKLAGVRDMKFTTKLVLGFNSQKLLVSIKAGIGSEGKESACSVGDPVQS